MPSSGKTTKEVTENNTKNLNNQRTITVTLTNSKWRLFHISRIRGMPSSGKELKGCWHGAGVPEVLYLSRDTGTSWLDMVSNWMIRRRLESTECLTMMVTWIEMNSLITLRNPMQ